jgi:preprotein translocase subunit SecD
MMEQFERQHKKVFWSILTANISELLVMTPYIVMSFVGFGLIVNQK